jgi:hypothetical protein
VVPPIDQPLEGGTLDSCVGVGGVKEEILKVLIVWKESVKERKCLEIFRKFLSQL